MNTTSLGRIEVRDADDAPGSRFDGLAVPYGIPIEVAYGRETFVRGAFADTVREVNSGKRLAYLNRHGEDGGVPVGIITQLQERDAGLHFAGEYMDVPETSQARSQVRSGIDGVSIEFVPGKFRRKGDLIEHFAGVRLAAVAGSYAPAYSQARVQLRKVGGKKVPSLTVSALTERRDAITSQIAVLRNVAETEDRGLDDAETQELNTLTARISNLDSLIADATVEAQRRDAERKALPMQTSTVTISRSELVYGPGTGHSFYADLIRVGRDAEATERMTRHKALVEDFARELETRAMDTSDLVGTYPTQNLPELYVPDLAYTGPLSRFFPSTGITSAQPITVPQFDTVTGDVGTQLGGENSALNEIEVKTKPLPVSPVAIGGKTVVSRQAIDGGTPGIDAIITNTLREMLMRDTERRIYDVLATVPVKYVIADTGGTGASQSGRDLVRGLNGAVADFYSVTRLLPAEGIFTSTDDWANLVAAEDTTGRPIMPFINPMNAVGTFSGVGYQQGVIGGTLVEPSWAIENQTEGFIARKNDARQFKSTVLNFRFEEQKGPESIVFAIWQYFAFAILQPAGVQKYTYTNV